MAVTLTSDINSNYWSLSKDEDGAIVTGLDDLVQQVLIALTTNKGSVPFDPEFGFNINELLDKPVNYVIPNGKVGILETLERDVPLISVSSVNHVFDAAEPHKVMFEVFCTSNLGNFTVQLDINQNYDPASGSPFSASAFSSGFA
jgi:phage baseplate assembly protein W